MKQFNVWLSMWIDLKNKGSRGTDFRMSHKNDSIFVQKYYENVKTKVNWMRAHSRIMCASGKDESDKC